MKRTLIALTLASSMALGSCATTTSSNTTDTIALLVADVQSVTVSLCSFLPEASSIVSIISAGSPALATATQIANAICKVATPAAAKASRLRGDVMLPEIQVNGQNIVIHGTYVPHR